MCCRFQLFCWITMIVLSGLIMQESNFSKAALYSFWYPFGQVDTQRQPDIFLIRRPGNPERL